MNITIYDQYGRLVNAAHYDTMTIHSAEPHEMYEAWIALERRRRRSATVEIFRGTLTECGDVLALIKNHVRSGSALVEITHLDSTARTRDERGLNDSGEVATRDNVIDAENWLGT